MSEVYRQGNINQTIPIRLQKKKKHYHYVNDLNDLKSKCIIKRCYFVYILDHCFNVPCNNGATCTSMGDSFQCTCADGFRGDTCNFNGG